MLLRRWHILWDSIKCLWEILYHVITGVWKLSKVPEPTVTVFGSSHIGKDSEYTRHARELGAKLARNGFSLITGGGPGIMEAANMGAYEIAQQCQLKEHIHDKSCKKRVVSIGIGLTRLNAEKVNPYVHKHITMDHFFTRKWLLVRYSVGFIIFPGGFGTFDELFEIVTLQQTDHMPRRPIVLFGSAYWKPLLNWIQESPLKDGYISAPDAQLLYLVDDIDEAIRIIQHGKKH